MDTRVRGEEPGGQSLTGDQKRGLLRWGIRESAGTIMVGLLLFLPAGTILWTAGWALVGVYAAWVTACAVLLIPRSPDLLIERASRRKDSRRWDMVVLSVIGMLTLVKYLLAGFDYRFGWTDFGAAWQWLGLLFSIFGNVLVTWSMLANAYFSMVVRMQKDRGHRVVSTGPYRFVRHPGYVGTILFAVGSGLLLGSCWALLVSGLEAAGHIFRTALEDRDLRQNLPGYCDYAEQVRWRLLPGIW